MESCPIISGLGPFSGLLFLYAANLKNPTPGVYASQERLTSYMGPAAQNLIG